MHFSRWLRSVLSLTFFLSVSFAFVNIFAQAEEKAWVDIGEGDEWDYFKGTKEPPVKWNHIGFEKGDKDWHKGRTGLGYGHERVRTELVDMKGNYLGVYARRDLILSSADYELLRQDSTGLTLSIVCDGPFKAWLNGVEVIRSHNRRVTPEQGLPKALEIDIASFARELLQVGSNVLAIWCANDRVDSDSFLFIPALKMRGE